MMSEDTTMPFQEEFWNVAHEYASKTGEPEFTNEMAYIMTTLHEEGC